MQEDNGSNIRKFELPGSKAHYSPSLSFTISYMQLFIEPEFKSKSIHCEQQLEVIAIQSIMEIILDICELQVKSVSSVAATNTTTAGNKSDNNNNNHTKELNFRNYGDKLIIKLDKMLSEGSVFRIAIVYSAKPRRGFYFIEPDEYYPKKNLQAWTQGQTIESKYWFPCLDHPLVKFESEISVIVPLKFIAISNGKLLLTKVQRRIRGESNNKKRKEEKKKVFIWTEPNPHPAYLTSVVIGKFVERRKTYNHDIEVLYYVPESKKMVLSLWIRADVTYNY
jgi:aminopeptidase N